MLAIFRIQLCVFKNGVSIFPGAMFLGRVKCILISCVVERVLNECVTSVSAPFLGRFVLNIVFAFKSLQFFLMYIFASRVW